MVEEKEKMLKKYEDDLVQISEKLENLKTKIRLLQDRNSEQQTGKAKLKNSPKENKQNIDDFKVQISLLQLV